jgi:hypothetical protein
LKVLIAATAASLIGQLAKPFTSGGDVGKIDIIKVAARSGGMPSTHSAVRLSPPILFPLVYRLAALLELFIERLLTVLGISLCSHVVMSRIRAKGIFPLLLQE